MGEVASAGDAEAETSCPLGEGPTKWEGALQLNTKWPQAGLPRPIQRSVPLKETEKCNNRTHPR